MAEVDDRELGRIRSLLEANKDKNFVQRILKPEDWPDMGLEPGVRGTHVMSWGTTGTGTPQERSFVFPTLVYDEKSKSLKNLGPGAFKHAIDTGEVIEMPSRAEADWFSKNYKRVWDK